MVTPDIMKKQYNERFDVTYLFSTATKTLSRQF
jgi:hypothetical protein